MQGVHHVRATYVALRKRGLGCRMKVGDRSRVYKINHRTRERSIAPNDLCTRYSQMRSNVFVMLGDLSARASHEDRLCPAGLFVPRDYIVDDRESSLIHDFVVMIEEKFI